MKAAVFACGTVLPATGQTQSFERLPQLVMIGNYGS